jgi:hypothetical protein
VSFTTFASPFASETLRSKSHTTRTFALPPANNAAARMAIVMDNVSQSTALADARTRRRSIGTAWNVTNLLPPKDEVERRGAASPAIEAALSRSSMLSLAYLSGCSAIAPTDCYAFAYTSRMICRHGIAIHDALSATNHSTLPNLSRGHPLLIVHELVGERVRASAKRIVSAALFL